MRAEFFTPKDPMLVTIAELQEALDAWVGEYNTARPHQSCGGRPPIERFRLAHRSLTADTTAAAKAPPPPAQVAGKRPAGVSRWVNAAGKISLAGFSYSAGATYAGEPAEVVVAKGLVDILHAGAVAAPHAQRLRGDQAGRKPRAQVARQAQDATKGLTVTRLADGAGVACFAGTNYAAGRRWARQPIDVTIVAGSRAAVPRRQGHPDPPDPPRPLPRTRRLRQPPRPRPPQELRHRLCQAGTGLTCRPVTRTDLSPRYQDLTSRRTGW
jgi:hypothetical protein